MPKNKASTQKRWDRTFGGCGTCRRRHVRCDQTRPSCQTCRAVGADCDGFKSDLRWVPQTINGLGSSAVASDNGQRRDLVRRHLFSEQSRKRMADSLRIGLTHGSVDASLDEIDSIADKTARQQQACDVIIGPFGMMQLSPSGPTPIKERSFDGKVGMDKDTDVADVVAQVPISSHLEDAQRTNHFDNDDEIQIMNDILQWDDIFGLGNQDLSQLSLDLLDPLFGLSNTMPADLQNRKDLQHQFSVQALNISEVAIGGGMDTTSATMLVKHLDPIAYGPQLLKHFRDNVMGHMSAVPVTTKSPWNSINLAAAIDTFAQVFVLKSVDVSSAKRAGLCGILAMSANHLSKNLRYDSDLHQTEQFWRDIAYSNKAEATRELQASLKGECYGPGKAKYKDQMSAILNMLGLAIQNGEQNDMRCYIVDAERLLRYRGIVKPNISRKARLLHHVYTWTRIVSESTYVLHDYKQFIERLRTQKITSMGVRGEACSVGPHTTHLDDFLRLEGESDKGEQISQGVDSQTDDDEARLTALRDMHLEDVRENPNTLMHMIYGVSETWLRLLSQTTRLANQLDAIKGSDYGPIPLALTEKASLLEEKICRYAASQPEAEASTTPHYHLYTALNSALVIFFYRRIRGVNAWILQNEVDNVIQALGRFDRELENHNLEGPGLVWPAFIAGCEATTPVRREHLLHWIRRAALKTSFKYYTQAVDILEILWNQSKAELSSKIRNTMSPSGFTWMDVLRERQLWLVGC